MLNCKSFISVLLLKDTQCIMASMYLELYVSKPWDKVKGIIKLIKHFPNFNNSKKPERFSFVSHQFYQAGGHLILGCTSERRLMSWLRLIQNLYDKTHDEKNFLWVRTHQNALSFL